MLISFYGVYTNLLIFQDGGWTNWFNTTSCDGTCGTGIQTAARNCTNPRQCNGGILCVPNNSSAVTNESGFQVETSFTPCPLLPCPISKCIEIKFVELW